MSNRDTAGQREVPRASAQVERTPRRRTRPKTAPPAGLETGAAPPPQHGVQRERPGRSEIGWHHEANETLSSQSRDESVFLFSQGCFAAPAASDFLDAQKVTKKAPGGGANRIRLRLILHVPHPLDPHLRERQLGRLSGYRKGAGSSTDWFPFYDRCR